MPKLGKMLPWLLGGVAGGLGAKALNAKNPAMPTQPDFSTLLTQQSATQAQFLLDQQTAAKRRNAAATRTANAGPRSTILTSGSGALGSAPTVTKTLLGQ